MNPSLPRMLKSLELFGFKSFADRTVFEFADGVTCVVGPNGSGKSNVVDALKWILGDQSAKSLRGKEMSDVIFNGSSGRKASSFAEATLTFDNAAGLLPVAAAEVQIGRRLHASGDSEYLLNRSAVRLKDIRELFMGTGAGTAAYSIIEQGRVDQILQANPTTRRVVFEEAAGISRFKARKIEAQRRLERVDQNLLRLRDLVDQIESRLNATRSQASKAAKYREYSTEYQRLWTGLAADDFRQATAQLSQLESQLAEQQLAIQSIDDELAARDDQLAGFDSRTSELDEQIRSVDRQRALAREAIAGHQTTVRHQTTQSRELAAETARLRQQRNTLARQLQSVCEELARTTERLETIGEDFNRQRDALAQREQRIGDFASRLQAARDAIEQRKSERESVRRQRSGREQQVAALDLRLATLKDARAQATASVAELIQRQATADAERDARQAALHDAELQVSTAQARIDHARQARRQLKQAHGASERQLATWREERSAKVARRQLLEDLEARHEGLNLGVREMLHRAASSQEQPWCLIRGNVGDLLQAELDDAPLLEVALGSRLQLLVIDDLSPMIDFLNTAIAEVSGRVGFVEVSSGTAGQPRPLVDLSDRRGVMARADRLVAASRIPGLAEQLLADTWVVETLDLAYRLLREEGTGCRFITLQGELLESDGTLFVGSTPNETAVISRKSELRLLKNEVRGLNDRIARFEESLEQLDSSLSETDGEIAHLQADLTNCLEELAARRSALASRTVECDRLALDRTAIEQQLEKLAHEEHDLRAQTESLDAALQDDDQTLAELADAIAQSEAAAFAIEQLLQEQQQRTQEEQLELAKHEERHASLQANHLRLVKDQQQRARQWEQADRQLLASRAKQWEITHAILAARSRLAEQFLTDDACALESRLLHTRRNELRTHRRVLQRAQDTLRDRRRDVTDTMHTIEMQSRDLRHQRQTLSARIADEFALDLSELVAQGASAYLSWVEPQEHDRDDERTGGDFLYETTQSFPEATPGDPAVLLESDTEPDAEFIDLEEARPSFAEARVEIEQRVDRLRRKIKNLGAINADSLKDLDELEEKFADLSGQLDDLEAAKGTLEEIIRRINVESRRLFLETFDTIRVHFQELYRKLFGGGEGDIVLEDPDDVLDCGIDIVARPPGKELRSISLLSGGEKTMTAVALLFAMFRSKPSPYCILDEVDAALDEANVDRYVSVVKEFRESTQFVIITHRKRTMTAADQLYGVTMEQAGVSKRLNVSFEDVREDGHFRTTSKAA